jgi:DUF2075 family protein
MGKRVDNIVIIEDVAFIIEFKVGDGGYEKHAIEQVIDYTIDVKNEISAPSWFLNDSQDIRSSYFLEEVATEFDIQGLEIDWACVAWGGNFHFNNTDWKYQNFKGTKWQNINKEIDKEYLKNTYRVLLTRARQGMVIFVPERSELDHTRPKAFYDETYEYLKEIGIQEIE